MARAIWKGAISFGLVTIPIRVHTAVEEKSFKFNQLHSKDQGRIKYKRTCAVDGEEVKDLDEFVKLYDESVKNKEGKVLLDIISGRNHKTLVLKVTFE